MTKYNFMQKEADKVSTFEPNEESEMFAKHLVSVIAKGEQHISLTLTEKGAIAFARELSNYILAENSLQMADENEDDNELLTKQEVKEKFNVSDTTLWLWAKKNYLVPIKIGRKVMYRTSDIKQLVNGKI